MKTHPRLTLASLATAFVATLSTLSAATITVEFTNADKEGVAPYTEVNVMIVPPGAKTLDEAIKFQSKEKSFVKKFENLKEGSYAILIFTGKEENRTDASRPGAFTKIERLKIETAESNEKVSIAYSPVDVTPFKGEASIKGSVVDHLQKPAAGIKLKVRAVTPAGYFTITEVTTDAEGKYEAKGLAEGKSYSVSDASGKNLAAISTARPPQPITLPLQAGGKAPDIDFIVLKDGKTQKLSDFKGKVVVIDFWASWCGPCQAPMAKMQTFREKHPEWGDKVVLMALSIDDTIDKASTHLGKNSWDKTHNTWAGDGGFKSKPPQAYAVRGIPSCFIIDQEGNISSAGHPASLDIPKLIDVLLSKKP